MSDPKRVSIAVTPRGPYIVSGTVEVVNVAGEPIATGPEPALCRCGYSKRKPFCDGAHGPYQFRGRPPAALPESAAKAYRGGQVDVHYQPAICAHVGACTRGLPQVFDTTRRPWVVPDNAEAAEVKAVVARCPSGALTIRARDLDPEPPPDRTRPPRIRALKDGPLAVEGTVDLEGVEWVDDAVRDRFTLCRCGASRLMPFCDGSHAEIGFKDG